MRTFLLAPVFLALAALSVPPPDKIPATGGDITIQPLNHATLQITWSGHVINVDPVGQADYTGLAAPDIVLVTDIHGDHLDPATIAKVKKAPTKVVAPSAAAAKLENPIVIANGETKTVDGISITAVPMYNLTRGRPPASSSMTRDAATATSSRSAASESTSRATPKACRRCARSRLSTSRSSL